MEEKNQVTLLNFMGNDEMVANTARVSYSKKANNYTVEQNNKLITYLAKHGHWSPFSSPQLQFRLQVPIYVERQLVKTEAGRVYNSVSGRYVDFSDTYYEIEQFRKQSTDSKQGSAEDFSEPENSRLLDIQNSVIILCKAAYDAAIELRCSKEQARSFLPLSLNTTMIWTGSLFTLIRLCNQRLKPEAQKETQMVVQAMLDAVLNLEGEPFKHSLSAYGYNK